MSENELKTPEEVAKFRTEMAKEAWGEDGEITDSPVVEEAGTEEVIETEEATGEEVEGKLDDPPAEGAGEEPPPDEGEEIVGLDALYKVIDGLEYRLKQTESRLGSATNEIYRLKTAAETASTQVKQQGAAAPTQEQIEEAKQDKEKWDKLRDSFPEWREVFDVLEKNEEGRPVSEPVNVEELRESVRQELQTDFSTQLSGVQKAFETKLVEMRFPGWTKDVQTPEFNTWKAGQTEAVQSLAASDRSEDAITLLGMFYESQGIKKEGTTGPSAAEVQASRERRLQRSGQPKKGGKPIKTKAVEDMTDEEYRDYLAANPDKI